MLQAELLVILFGLEVVKHEVIGASTSSRTQPKKPNCPSDIFP